MSEKRNAYKSQFRRERYYSVQAFIPLEKRENLRAYAEQHGLSMSALITAALEQYTGLDLAGKD